MISDAESDVDTSANIFSFSSLSDYLSDSGSKSDDSPINFVVSPNKYSSKIITSTRIESVVIKKDERNVKISMNDFLKNVDVFDGNNIVKFFLNNQASVVGSGDDYSVKKISKDSPDSPDENFPNVILSLCDDDKPPSPSMQVSDESNNYNVDTPNYMMTEKLAEKVSRDRKFFKIRLTVDDALERYRRKCKYEKYSFLNFNLTTMLISDT